MEKKFQIIADDPYLEPFQDNFKDLQERYHSLLTTYQDNEGGLSKFSEGYKRFGVHQQNCEVTYTEWAPAAQEVSLYGEFNQWNESQHQATKDKYGIWQLKFKGSIP